MAYNVRIQQNRLVRYCWARRSLQIALSEHKKYYASNEIADADLLLWWVEERIRQGDEGLLRKTIDVEAGRSVL